MKYLKKAVIMPDARDQDTRNITNNILNDIKRNGEQRAIYYSEKFDSWHGDVLVNEETITEAKSSLSQQLKDDIQFAHDKVSKFAERQLDSIREFECELSPGVWAGQKLIPIRTAGCYVPGGRYAHVASAIMSITTARVAGVSNVIAASTPKPEYSGIHPAILYTMDLCGADRILAMGGVQGIASMAFGLFTGHKANILVGPGNRFVAEAKRILYGEVGIDLFAGPTEILIIADDSADAELVSYDLVGQAEHGIDSPAWLITTSETLGKEVIGLVPDIIDALPEEQRQTAAESWRNYGEVIVCDSDEEAARLSDEYAPEHLEVQAGNLAWYERRLRNYGSLFIGEETTVAFGDKCSGANHILPTRRAGCYTGGLSVHKFIKVVTTQRANRQGSKELAMVAARLSRLEGMEAHARTGDIRLKHYFPGQKFTTGI